MLTEFALCREVLRQANGRLWLWGQSDRYSRAGIDAIVSQCTAWGVTDYVIGLNAQEDRDFKLDRSAADYVVLSLRLREAGVRVHLMTWARNNKAFIENAVRQLVSLADKTGATSVQLDAEEAWRHTSGAGTTRRPAETGAAEWFDGFDELPEGCEVGVTSYAYIPPSVVPLARAANYVIPQAYSQYSTEKDGRDGAIYVPPATQRVARERWSPHLGAHTRLVMGLAAYNQKRPGRTVTEEMRRAFCGAIRNNVVEVAYWSRIHLAKNAEAARVVASIRSGA